MSFSDSKLANTKSSVTLQKKKVRVNGSKYLDKKQDGALCLIKIELVMNWLIPYTLFGLEISSSIAVILRHIMRGVASFLWTINRVFARNRQLFWEFGEDALNSVHRCRREFRRLLLQLITHPPFKRWTRPERKRVTKLTTRRCNNITVAVGCPGWMSWLGLMDLTTFEIDAVDGILRLLVPEYMDVLWNKMKGRARTNFNWPPTENV